MPTYTLGWCSDFCILFRISVYPQWRSPLAHRCCDMQIRKRSPLSAAGAAPGQHVCVVYQGQNGLDFSPTCLLNLSNRHGANWKPHSSTDLRRMHRDANTIQKGTENGTKKTLPEIPLWSSLNSSCVLWGVSKLLVWTWIPIINNIWWLKSKPISGTPWEVRLDNKDVADLEPPLSSWRKAWPGIPGGL